jgi:hypothetical protein
MCEDETMDDLWSVIYSVNGVPAKTLCCKKRSALEKLRELKKTGSFTLADGEKIKPDSFILTEVKYMWQISEGKESECSFLE